LRQHTENGGGETAAAGLAVHSLIEQLFGSTARPSTANAASKPLSLPEFETGRRMAEAKYRTLIELLPAVTFMATFGEGLSDLYVSPQIEAILGYTQKEWAENPVLWYQRLHPEDRNRWNLEFARTVAAGEPLASAYRFFARNGKIVWIHAQARIVRDETGRPSFIHGIGVDITQVKEAEQKVREYADKLERTNKELEQFAYVASHDLQEPLRSIQNYSLILTDDYRGRLDSRADQYFDRIIQSAKRMKRLIQALLEFSRVGRSDRPAEPTDLMTVVREATTNLAAAIEESGAQVCVEPLPNVLSIRTNMLVLFQNLIGNAIKYRSDRPPEVRISAVKNNDHWVISVSDTGLGIAPEHHERIFEIFQRLHTQKEYPGTGIGLSICKKIVELHGGKIWVESEPNKGSTFKFTLKAVSDVRAK
jgi:PAS domain S-box-containing protein